LHWLYGALRRAMLTNPVNEQIAVLHRSHIITMPECQAMTTRRGLPSAVRPPQGREGAKEIRDSQKALCRRYRRMAGAVCGRKSDEI